jgi:hypothetical protein
MREICENKNLRMMFRFDAVNILPSFLKNMKNKESFTEKEISRLHGVIVYFRFIERIVLFSWDRKLSSYKNLLCSFMFDCLVDEVNHTSFTVKLFRSRKRSLRQ